MNEFIIEFWSFYAQIFWGSSEGNFAFANVIQLLPMFILLELPYSILIALGVSRWAMNKDKPHDKTAHLPKISCIVLCYSEGEAVVQTIRSLLHQDYDGVIEIMTTIDGTTQNHPTLVAAQSCLAESHLCPKRILKIVEKPIRGGRVSSLNSGLAIASGEVVLALDGDTSFDNDMASQVAKHFANPNVAAVSGNLRVRNGSSSWVAKTQELEYLLGITYGRLGLAEWNIINNVSGAFGCFRKELLEHLGGWSQGTAEDLDMTTRIKHYFGKHPEMRIVFEPHAVGHTDAPDSLKVLYQQRLRWDGDLSFIYLRKHWQSFSPRLLGWRNFALYVMLGLVVQLALPFLIVAYHIWLFTNFTLAVSLAMVLFVHLCYLFMASLSYAHYLVIVSREKVRDLKMILYLPIFPIYNLILRVLMIWFFANEMIFRTHRDSSMAPWWVLKRQQS